LESLLVGAQRLHDLMPAEVGGVELGLVQGLGHPLQQPGLIQALQGVVASLEDELVDGAYGSRRLGHEMAIAQHLALQALVLLVHRWPELQGVLLVPEGAAANARLERPIDRYDLRHRLPKVLIEHVGLALPLLHTLLVILQSSLHTLQRRHLGI